MSHGNALQSETAAPAELRLATIGRSGEQILLFSCHCRIEEWPDGDRIASVCARHHGAFPVAASLVRYEL